MFRSAIAAFLVLTGIAAAESPKQSDVNWAWASVTCKDGVCKVDCQREAIAWAWANAKTVHPDDLPEKEACNCGTGCCCCINGQCDCKNGECRKQTQAQHYDKLRARAIREGTPLIVAVGCEAPRVDGCLSCRWDQFPGVKSGLVVSTVNNKELWRAATLASGSTPAAIKAAAFPKPAATPAVNVRVNDGLQ